jgi:hypothetical protein
VRYENSLIKTGITILADISDGEASARIRFLTEIWRALSGAFQSFNMKGQDFQ